MQPSSWRGPAAMTAAMGLFSVNDALVKSFGATLPVAQSIAIRGIIATVATLAVVAFARDARRIVADAMGAVVVLRACAECFAIFCLIHALTRLPIGDVTAISQIVPLLLLPAAALFLGERVRPAQWALVVAGFLGVVLIAKPGRSGFDPTILLALMTAAGFAARDLLAPRIPRDTTALAVSLSTLVLVAAVGVVVAIIGGLAPATPAQIAGLGAAGLLLAVGQGLIYLAFRWAPVSDVGPFNYSKTLFGLIMGVLVFGERPDLATILGAALVIASGVGIALLASARMR